MFTVRLPSSLVNIIVTNCWWLTSEQISSSFYLALLLLLSARPEINLRSLINGAYQGYGELMPSPSSRSKQLWTFSQRVKTIPRGGSVRWQPRWTFHVRQHSGTHAALEWDR
jgi:hypothetical protein